MIEVSHLTKRYGKSEAIHNLNFRVAKGEVVGFLGPNGAGKSTTMKIITGYMPPTEGFVKVAGLDVFESPIEVKKRIGFLPETPPLYTDMYVKDFLNFVANLKGVPKAQVQQNVQRALEKTNLVDVKDRLIQNLSKGFKQRVGIAQALVSNPEILILDEPTVGLDPKQVAEIRTLIQELAGQHTVILSTHILSEVQAICRRIIIINKGKIIAEDTLAGLNARTAGEKRVIVRTRNPDPTLVKKLESIAGVVSVTATDDPTLLSIMTEVNSDLQDQIAAMVVSSGCGLVEIRSQDFSLEDIFLKLTNQQQKVEA